MSRPRVPSHPQPQTITLCYIDVTLDDLASAVSRAWPDRRVDHFAR
jgi:hypothetical protein